MPEHTSQSERLPRVSKGITAKVDARLLRALEEKAKTDLAHAEKKKKPTGMRAGVGYTMLGVWLVFIIAEYFHLVEHQNTAGHWILQTAPLVIGLFLVAPDVVEAVKDLAMWVVGILAKIRKIKVTIPQDKPDQE